MDTIKHEAADLLGLAALIVIILISYAVVVVLERRAERRRTARVIADAHAKATADVDAWLDYPTYGGPR